jgi:hypothetical protein
MSTQNWFVLTPEQRAAAMAFNSPSGEIDPRLVDGESPGVGININPDAVGFEPAAVVALDGMYVAPKRLVDLPGYSAEGKAYLLTLPFALLESETIFAPVVVIAS